MKTPKLTPVEIGKRSYDERTVTVTDPCYDSDAMCVVRTRIRPGTYKCIAWSGREYFKDYLTGKRRSCTRVFACGIYPEGDIPPKGSREEIGFIGVDAGLAGFFQDKPDYDEEAWGALCGKIYNKNSLILEEGFCTSSGYGDGEYPVYAYKNQDGETIALEISFL